MPLWHQNYAQNNQLKLGHVPSEVEDWKLATGMQAFTELKHRYQRKLISQALQTAFNETTSHESLSFHQIIILFNHICSVLLKWDA